MAAKASRVAFGEALLELGARDDRIVTVDADLSKSTMTAKFAKTYPGRAFNVGIAESNMIGIGAGLALAGRIPFVCSFACFVVGRFETIRISVAYTNANVKIVGTHAGIAIGEDGYSRSEEHTSELQSLAYLVCRLLLEKKKQPRPRVRRQAQRAE